MIEKATPTISTLASSGTLLGGPVRDVATLAGGNGPTGTVMFRLFTDNSCANQVFSSAGTVSGTTAASDWFTPAATGTYYWTAVYGGDTANNDVTSACNAPNESVEVAPFAPPAFTRTISGDLLGPVTVNPGGSLNVVNSSVSRGISADAPAFLSLCGVQVSGPPPATALSVTNAAVPVRIGDPAASCAGNRFAGQVVLTADRQ